MGPRLTARFCTLLLLGIGGPAAGASSTTAASPPFGAPTATDRILVIAPHPDDESLCCAGIIHRTLAYGGNVGIVWMTSGDAFEFDAMVVEHRLRPGARSLERLADIRMQEARAAAMHLGVRPENLYFLGFPDRGLAALLGNHFSTPYTSPYTRASRAPYPGVLTPGAEYTGATVMREIARVIDAYKPTLVLAPILADTHPDHAATSVFVQRALSAAQQLDRGRYWVVHGGNGWPNPRGLRRDLAQSLPLVALDLPWQRFALTTSDQQAKLDAIREHRSQLELMRRKMLSFVRADELYSVEP